MTAMLIGDQPQSPGVRQPLVLVIEGDARLATFLERALAAAGYPVEHTRDGLQALALFEDQAPDIVLIDPVLPGLSGLDVAGRRRAGRDGPIVMLPPRDGIEDRVAGLDAGADDYLAKPVAVEELLARLRAVRR